MFCQKQENTEEIEKKKKSVKIFLLRVATFSFLKKKVFSEKFQAVPLFCCSL